MFTGAGRRREWSPAQKAKIIAESYAGQSSVCDVARRHEGEPVIGPTGAGRVMVATKPVDFRKGEGGPLLRAVYVFRAKR